MPVAGGRTKHKGTKNKKRTVKAASTYGEAYRKYVKMYGGENNETTDNNGTHTHSTNDPGHSHTWLNGLEGDDSGTGGSYQEYTRAPGSVTGVIATSTTGITINSAGDHNHTFTSNSTGGGNAHNNMEPFMALRYIIRF